MKIKNILQLSPFLLFGYCNISLGLGVGEIVIRSQLGEPLAAQVNITDIEKAPDARCFSLTDLTSPPAFTKATVAIKHLANSYLLVISTHEAITDPILNVHLSHHCDPVIDREYTVLLDPPLESTAQNDPQHAEDVIRSDGTKKPVASYTSRQADANSDLALKPRPANENKNKKKPAAISSLDDKLTAIYTGIPKGHPSSRGNPEIQAQSRPRLMISSGGLEPGTMHTLPQPMLRLETQINLSRTELAEPLNSTDVMDELTAIDNRLTLLKGQITNLQDQNEKLKKDANAAQLKLENTMSSLRIAAGLIALLAFVEWLRRRLMHMRLAKAEDKWFQDNNVNNLNTEFNSTDTASANVNIDNAKNAVLNDAFDEKSDYGLTSGFDTTLNTSASASVNGHDEDILESIDVLIEYARYSLAIQLLHDYLANHPAESPKVWLKLLSLIAEHGTEADYMHTVDQCSQYYRIKMPSFAESRKTDTATLEDFPFITKELESVWGSAGALALLDDLIYNRESQPEDGFEPEIFEQLFLLKQIVENLDAEPTNIHATPEVTSRHYPETNVAEDVDNLTQALTHHDVSATPQKNASEQAGMAINISHAESHDAVSDETLPTLNFDDYFTHTDTPQPSSNFISDNTALSNTDEHITMPVIDRTTLDAPEIDFLPHTYEVADVHNTATEPASKTPAETEVKPQKRIAKDSNLIDWIVTDEN